VKKTLKTIAFAESCTGGWVSKQITDIPGSSKYFLGSVVAYSNASKKRILGVKDKTLKAKGAVSKEVALEMARGARRLFRSSRAVSLTGIAGPSGGTKEKPIGTVFIAFSSPRKTQVWKFHFKGTRNKIRKQAARKAIWLLGKSTK
jgi:PncC family amidohydrolase